MYLIQWCSSIDIPSLKVSFWASKNSSLAHMTLLLFSKLQLCKWIFKVKKKSQIELLQLLQLKVYEWVHYLEKELTCFLTIVSSFSCLIFYAFVLSSFFSFVSSLSWLCLLNPKTEAILLLTNTAYFFRGGELLFPLFDFESLILFWSGEPRFCLQLLICWWNS